MLQAYFDDSKDGASQKYLVLAGYMADSSVWSNFSRDWTELLTMTPRIDAFKFSRFRMDDELSSERLRHFYRCIERHELAALCVGVPIDQYNHVCEEIGLPEFLRDPYNLAFVGAYIAVERYAEFQDIREPCELIFDQQDVLVSKARAGWDLMQKMGARFRGEPLLQPQFMDDTVTIPLQAADMCAGLFRRRWEREGTILQKSVPIPWESRGRQRGFVLEHDMASMREALANVQQLYEAHDLSPSAADLSTRGK